MLPLGRLVRAFSTGLSTVFVDNLPWGKPRPRGSSATGCDWLISPHSEERPGIIAMATVFQRLFTILSTGFVHNFLGRSLQLGARVCVQGYRQRRTFLQSGRFVGACLASERPAKPAGRMPERLFVLPLDRSLESCRELRSLSRAGPAFTSHKKTRPEPGFLGATKRL